MTWRRLQVTIRVEQMLASGNPRHQAWLAAYLQRALDSQDDKDFPLSAWRWMNDTPAFLDALCAVLADPVTCVACTARGACTPFRAWACSLDRLLLPWIWPSAWALPHPGMG